MSPTCRVAGDRASDQRDHIVLHCHKLIRECADNGPLHNFMRSTAPIKVDIGDQQLTNREQETRLTFSWAIFHRVGARQNGESEGLALPEDLGDERVRGGQVPAPATGPDPVQEEEEEERRSRRRRSSGRSFTASAWHTPTTPVYSTYTCSTSLAYIPTTLFFFFKHIHK